MNQTALSDNGRTVTVSDTTGRGRNRWFEAKLSSWKKRVITIVKHRNDTSHDVILRDASKIARINGVTTVQCLQPIVIIFGAAPQSWYGNQPLGSTDGIARNSGTTGYHQSFYGVARHGESNDVAFLDGLAHQSTIREQRIALDTQAIAATINEQPVATLISRFQPVPGHPMY